VRGDPRGDERDAETEGPRVAEGDASEPAIVVAAGLNGRALLF
jgi:hypothetical protein